VPIHDLPPRLLEPSSLDQLFAAPLKTFVAERKRLADRLKASGDRQAAKALAKTPRPSVSAWIVNQLARQDGPLLREFAALTDRLRGAQGQTARSKSDGDASELLAEHRAAIKRLRGRAEEILLASGQAVRPQILDRVLRNLRFGMADAAIRPTIESGRLIEDVAAEAGFAGLFGRSDEAPTAVPRSSDGSSDSSDAESRDRRRAPGKSAARSQDHIVGRDPDGRARRAAAEGARAAAARASEETKARARAQAERVRARGEAEVRIRTLQARADGARRSLEKARRDADLARQALAHAEDDLRSAELAVQGCGKQLAEAQAELEDRR
jgi:hypothetical protein